jgi:hypothetical protein
VPLQQGVVALHAPPESMHRVHSPSVPHWPEQHSEAPLQCRPVSRRQQQKPFALQYAPLQH